MYFVKNSKTKHNEATTINNEFQWKYKCPFNFKMWLGQTNAIFRSTHPTDPVSGEMKKKANVFEVLILKFS